MEIPVIRRFNDFQLARFQSVSIAYNFCKWSALILALVATCGSLINRIKILIIRFRRRSHSLASSNLLISDLDDEDFSSSDCDDGSYSYSSPSSLSTSEFEEGSGSTSSSYQWRRVDEDFKVRGSGHHFDDQLQSGKVRHRRRCSIGEIFSLSEIANRESVVKLWDSIGFGFGLDFDDSDYFTSSSSAISGLEPQISPLSSLSPAVVVTAGENASGNLAVTVWDTRLRRRTPAVIAEWEANQGKVVGVGAGGVEKVYVREDVHNGVTVGDMRKVRSPLVNITEPDVDTWWDADAVIVSNESFSDNSFLRRK
ncbi:putative transmembrane protein [Senna tora]|uniref:Putative transmembrane protein n=1 Tax=Senna tora TaxID=362788 RepID=A0A834WRT2_9FABA|nr:putative transmembrane protein [Senna tora]